LDFFNEKDFFFPIVIWALFTENWVVALVVVFVTMHTHWWVITPLSESGVARFRAVPADAYGVLAAFLCVAVFIALST
jgi:hypothetical protein